MRKQSRHTSSKRSHNPSLTFFSVWGAVKLHVFQLRHLVRFCKKHGLDLYEIDGSLTYHENKKHLESLVPNFDQETRLDEWATQEEWYMENHFLLYYISCILEGSTKSSTVGAKDTSKPAFSLRLMKPLSPFSLSAYVKR